MPSKLFPTVIGFGTLAIAGFACKAEPKLEATPSASATAAAPMPGELAVGVAIVAASAANSFTEGKVTAIEGSKVTYEYGDVDKGTGKRPSYSVDKGKAFLLGGAPKVAPKVGDFVIAKNASGSWTGCEVKNADAAVLSCEDWYGKANNVDAKAVIVPDPATGADIRDSLAKANRHRAFEAAAKAAGKPSAPKGWRPKAKESVVASFVGSSWYGATILKVDGEKATIKWDTTVWTQTPEKMFNEVVPLPKGVQKVREGQFVLVQPRAVGSAWEFRKVVAVTKDSAEVVDRDETKSTISLKELLPVVP